MLDKYLKEGKVLWFHTLHIPFGHIARERLPMRMHELERMAIEHQPRRTPGDPTNHPLHYRKAEHAQRGHVDGEQEGRGSHLDDRAVPRQAQIA